MTNSKFIVYKTIQKSGITNMLDVRRVIELSNKMFKEGITEEDCLDIMKNYSTYDKKFGFEK